MKNSAIFISELMKSDDQKWIFAISRPVADLLSEWGKLDGRFHVFDASPARSKKSRSYIRTIVKDNNITAVYTMAGPAYVDFSCLHVQGISNPYITHARIKDILSFLSIRKCVKLLFHVLYQSFWALKADYFFFQTNSSKEGFMGRFGVKESRCFVIPNALDTERFQESVNLESELAKNVKPRFVILCPAAPYLHKGLQLIPSIAKSMIDIDKSLLFEFRLTIPSESTLFKTILSEAKLLGVEGLITTNNGFSYADAPLVYSEADAVFIPSLIETFSATYLEALAKGKPLIVADRSFAREVCGDSAIYTEPLDKESCAQVLLSVVNEEILEAHSKAALETSITQLERARLIKKHLKTLVDREVLR